jgi:hypothetical protein
MGGLISPEYLELQRQLHAKGNYGTSSGRWIYTISSLAAKYECRDILDYGCGEGNLKKSLGEKVREYDPCQSGKDADPEPADLVVCTDVLEHIEPDYLDRVLTHLSSKVRKAFFFTIALYPARKKLADGRNAHLIVESADWWRERLSRYFKLAEWDVRKVRPGWEGTEVTALALADGVVTKTGIRPHKRRKLSRKFRKQAEAFFETIREGSRRYSDKICKIETFEFWEGDGDREADCQVVIDILEHQWDVHAALADIKRMAKHAVFLVIRLDFRGADYWKDVIGNYFAVTQVHEQDGAISLIANAKTLVPGLKIKAAGTEESRWENIITSVNKYRDCLEEEPPHDRYAIIACYGPSMKDTWPILMQQAADKNSVVVSVSGAHDFLLGKGIIPDFHIECDPREHKADNMAQAHPDVEYLMASTCHPRMFAKVDGMKVRLWHSVGGEVAVRIVDELQSKAPIIFGGGSVGLRALPVMFRKGYRKFLIHGMDCSFADEGREKWAGPHAQKQNPKEQQVVKVRYDGRFFATTGILLSYGTDFFDMVNRMRQADPSLEIRVFGDGLLQARVAGPHSPIEVLPQQEAA